MCIIQSSEQLTITFSALQIYTEAIDESGTATTEQLVVNHEGHNDISMINTTSKTTDLNGNAVMNYVHLYCKVW